MASAANITPGYLQESQQGTILGVTILFIILETLSVAFRGVSKLIGRLNWGWDDGLIVLGFILCMVINGCAIGMSFYLREKKQGVCRLNSTQRICIMAASAFTSSALLRRAPRKSPFRANSCSPSPSSTSQPSSLQRWRSYTFTSVCSHKSPFALSATW